MTRSFFVSELWLISKPVQPSFESWLSQSHKWLKCIWVSEKTCFCDSDVTHVTQVPIFSNEVYELYHWRFHVLSVFIYFIYTTHPSLQPYNSSIHGVPMQALTRPQPALLDQIAASCTFRPHSRRPRMAPQLVSGHFANVLIGLPTKDCQLFLGLGLLGLSSKQDRKLFSRYRVLCQHIFVAGKVIPVDFLTVTQQLKGPFSKTR